MGGFSLVHKDAVLKEHPYIQRYLRDCREGIVRDLGGEEAMSTMQMVLVDRLISRMAICRLIECYVEKFGAFSRPALDRKALELEPVMASYLSFSNSIDRSLASLGLKRRDLELRIMSPQELLLQDAEVEDKAPDQGVQADDVGGQK
jgi:hypothetical protein